MKYTKEYCQIIASNYPTKGQFKKNEPYVYHASWSHNWLIDFYGPRKNSIWTLDKCKEESLKYTSRRELKINNKICYNFIAHNSWQKECFSHYPNEKLKKITKEEILELARQSQNSFTFQQNNFTAWNHANRNGYYKTEVKSLFKCNQKN